VCALDFVELAAGDSFACGRRGSGQVECWGLGDEGEIGDGANMRRGHPVPIADAAQDFAEIAAGQQFACARRESGAVVCWGRNDQGQLGDGTMIDTNAPVDVVGITDAVQIGCGQSHACARHADGHVSCWGGNFGVMLGNPEVVENTVPTPVDVADLDDAIELSVGGRVACVRRASGALVCWGQNTAYQLGDTGPGRPQNMPVTGLDDARDVSAGFDFVCARDADNTVQCWGANVHGQLANGTTTPTAGIAAPAPAMLGLTNVVRLAAGDFHGCARGRVGIVECWGFNANGQLGDGTTTDSTSGVRVSGLDDARELAAGNDATCALRDTGAVVCWGNNTYGQLGDDFGGAHLTPSPILDP
jgi:alpha-tubulin suppressor-like RCC1 family protein